MALPRTAAELRVWTVDVALAGVAAGLGWTTASAQVGAVVDEVAALLDAGATTDAAILAEGGTLKLLALARWRAWSAAYDEVLMQYDLTAGSGAKLVRSQYVEFVYRRLLSAEAAVSAYPEAAAALAGSGGTAYVTTIGAGPPYGWSDEWAG